MKAVTVRQRLQQVVDSVFHGNVRAAAEAAGVEQPTLHRILAGKVTEPRLSTLEKLADEFGVTLDWVLGTAEHLPPEGPGSDKRLPLWWHLVALYNQRAQREARVQIDSLKPQTAAGKRVIREYWEFRRLDRTRMLFRVCLQPILDEGKRIPGDFLPAWRSLLEMETRMCELALQTLVRLGELTQR